MTLVIANPASASGTTGEAWPGIASDIRTYFGPFRVAFTKRRGDALSIASEAARKGVKLIVACGGDGTISEVANGILSSGKGAELGILPSGTGGDFRRTLGIPSRARDAAMILKEGKTRVIDVGRVSFVDREGAEASRYFLGVASFGMSADVIDRVKQHKRKGGRHWLGGQFAFGMSMFQTALQAAATRVVVQLDDQNEQHLTVANFCVANARFFGGGMKIAPDAKLSDGEFDVISIGDLGARKILTNAPRLYLGSHLGLEQVGQARAKKVHARPAANDVEVALEVDGELPGRLPATFQVVPKALRVRCSI